MKTEIAYLMKIPDSIISKIHLKIFKEKNSLNTFIFHGLFKNEEEKSLNTVDPQPWITIDQFEEFIEYHLKHDYKFVSPDDIINGLNKDKKYIMITFDDGYYNNIHALPILKKYKIPATFFISTKHIQENKCFWWDILYRERTKQKTPVKEIVKERDFLKSKTNQEIEEHLKKIFGKNILKPTNDINRPFTVSELKEFSKEKNVFIGNHTADHAILTNYSADEISLQIINAQKSLYEITGIKPIAISYPDGRYSDDIIKISKESGLKIGVTVEYRKNSIPLDFDANDKCMLLGRFDISGNVNIIRQCELFRSGILLYSRFGKILKER